MADEAMGPPARSTVLTAEQEAMIFAFRKHTLLPLDVCLYALQASVPQLSRSALHRCSQRHGISRLPDLDGHPAAKSKKFKNYHIGYFHIDFTEVRTAEGRLFLFVAVVRATRRVCANSASLLITALTPFSDNDNHFITPGKIRSANANIKLSRQRGELLYSCL